MDLAYANQCLTGYEIVIVQRRRGAQKGRDLAFTAIINQLLTTLLLLTAWVSLCKAWQSRVDIISFTSSANNRAVALLIAAERSLVKSRKTNSPTLILDFCQNEYDKVLNGKVYTLRIVSGPWDSRRTALKARTTNETNDIYFNSHFRLNKSNFVFTQL